LYSQADLFLFPSTTDTQGLVLAEAMACQTPVLAIEGIGQADIVKNAQNGFLVVTAEQMAERIVQVAQDRGLHQHLRVGAYQTAQQYHPDYLVKDVLSLYQRVLNS